MLKMLGDRYKNIKFPIGSVFCFTHLKKEQIAIPDDREHDSDKITNNARLEHVDPEYQPEEVNVTDENLNISEEASTSLNQSLETNPLSFQIKKVYTKSDNAGCYHTSYSAEALYFMCQEEGVQLLRYDFNEPCKGKDQCDRESASAKTIIRSYVDAGNDLTSAEDVFNAMRYGFGVKDAICVAEINCKISSVSGPKVGSFASYHSIKFTEDGMKLWIYFNVGNGIFQPFLKVHFRSGLNVLKDFSRTDQAMNKPKQKSTMRDGREINNLLFCPEVGCSEVFEDVRAYDEYTMEGRHTTDAPESTMMDKIRRSFVSRIKLSSQIHMPLTRGDNLEAEVDLQTACNLYSTMQVFQHMGWALPVRSTFRYSYKQKKILYEYFMQGEVNGKKMSADQVEKLSRKQLTISEYITSKHIKSLFSRWSRLLREGKLK